MRPAIHPIATAVRLSLLLTIACPQPWLENIAAAPDEGPKAAADFFVSPWGKDTWSGKWADPGASDGPFRTLARARDAVRALLRTQKEPRRVRVVLRGGIYYLPHPGEEMPSAEIIAPCLTQVLRVVGCAGASVHDLRGPVNKALALSVVFLN